MARIRTIKPEFFLSETLGSVSLTAERSFSGLLTQADDHGRMRDVPAVLNGALWPMRGSHTAKDMESDLVELAEVGVICRYEVAGRRFVHLPSWLEHQRINKPSRSKVPPCPAHEAVETAVAAAGDGAGQLPLEGDTSGKSLPQGRKKGSAARASGSAATLDAAGSDGVSRVTRIPGGVSGVEEPPPWLDEPDLPESAGQGVPDGAFVQVSDLEGPSVSHVTRLPHPTSAGEVTQEGADRVAGTPEPGGDEAFVQVSGLNRPDVSRVTRVPDFSPEERKGTGKGKERRPSTLRVLDACARDAHEGLTDQPGPGSACGGQTATASPPGPDVADTSDEQTLAVSAGETAADAAEALTEEEQVSADPNQGGLFEVPEDAAATAQAKEAKPKRKPNSAMTEERKALARAILNPWWVMYGKGWGQSYGVVYSVLCSALKNGMTEKQIKDALLILGPEKTPVSGGTMQFALKKHAKSAEAATAVQAARRDASTFKHVM